jgi:hypothetical protein
MQQNTVNPDHVCQQAVGAKLGVYQAKEHFESVLKRYNDQIDSLVNVIGMMKKRIVELETEVSGKRTPRPEEETGESLRKDYVEQKRR